MENGILSCSAMQNYSPPYILLNISMVSSDESYDSTSSEERSNSHRGSAISTLTSSPLYQRTDIDVLTGSLHNNRMDNMSPGSEPISLAMARLQKQMHSPMAMVIWSPKKQHHPKKREEN
jgi:hypothetical protein